MSTRASFLSSSAAQQLKKGFFVSVGLFAILTIIYYQLNNQYLTNNLLLHVSGSINFEQL
jgi:hypothetical protein